MKQPHDQDGPGFLTQLGGFLGTQVIQAWMRTLEYRIAYYDPRVDPARRDWAGPAIYVFWHEHILLPLYLRGHCNLVMLLSRHRDADVLARVAYHMGFECVRGSTYRGATTALRELTRRSHRMNLTITPDGPRGPRRQLTQGSIYLASKLELPIVAMGFAYDRQWCLNSWDRFAIPKPMARARAVVSPRIHIPPLLDRNDLERHRRYVEQLLNRLTTEAEQWATSGSRYKGEQIFRKSPAPHVYENEPYPSQFTPQLDSQPSPSVCSTLRRSA